MGKSFDVIVIGGGQTGLSAAYFLRRPGLSFVILDDSDTAGGVWTKTGLPPLKWSFAMFRKTEGTHGQQATQARRDCHEVTTG